MEEELDRRKEEGIGVREAEGIRIAKRDVGLQFTCSGSVLCEGN